MAKKENKIKDKDAELIAEATNPENIAELFPDVNEIEVVEPEVIISDEEALATLNFDENKKDKKEKKEKKVLFTKITPRIHFTGPNHTHKMKCLLEYVNELYISGDIKFDTIEQKDGSYKTVLVKND